jgi:hypothetical protein
MQYCLFSSLYIDAISLQSCVNLVKDRNTIYLNALWKTLLIVSPCFNLELYMFNSSPSFDQKKNLAPQLLNVTTSFIIFLLSVSAYCTASGWIVKRIFQFSPRYLEF